MIRPHLRLRRIGLAPTDSRDDALSHSRARVEDVHHTTNEMRMN